MYDGFVFLRTARRSFDGDALHCETFECRNAMCVRSSVMWLYLFRLMRVPAGCATLCVLWFCLKFRRLCATSVISHSHILSAGGGWHKCHCDCCRLLPCVLNGVMSLLFCVENILLARCLCLSCFMRMMFMKICLNHHRR